MGLTLTGINSNTQEYCNFKREHTRQTIKANNFISRYFDQVARIVVAV